MSIQELGLLVVELPQHVLTVLRLVSQGLRRTQKGGNTDTSVQNWDWLERWDTVATALHVPKQENRVEV